MGKQQTKQSQAQIISSTIDEADEEQLENQQETKGDEIQSPTTEGTSENAPTKTQQQGPLTNEQLFERWKQDMVEDKQAVPRMIVQHFKGGSSQTMDIIMDNISLLKGGKELLVDTNLSLVQGHKYGLIGRNGVGKSCLMSAILQREFLGFPDHLQILLVEQEITGDMKTPLEWVLETDVERTELLEELHQLENEQNSEQIDPTRIIDINKRLNEIFANDAQSRALQILAGLGFSKQMVGNPTKNLSGGWRMRVTLARALFVKPDILLLDEPTNHLDLDAVMWLEGYLNDCDQTVVVVSHAREFLNNVCNKIIHFHDQELVYYDGNYDSFEQKRNEDMRNQKKQYEKQQDKIEHTQKFIDQFRANKKRASLVQSRIKALEQMEVIEDVVEEDKTIFNFPAVEVLRPPCLKLEAAEFGYDPTQLIVQGVDFFVDCTSRVAIVGSNGAGQSTVLKMLLGTVEVTGGHQYRNPRLRVSCFTQHHVDMLELSVTPIEQLRRQYPNEKEESYRAHLGTFGLKTKLQVTPIYMLSGGQKSRVAFAAAVYNNPHILILDEPTNHLDLDAVDALVTAIKSYTGGVLIVSHDEHLIKSVCTDIFYVKNGSFQQFKGDFDDYRSALSKGKL